MKKLMLTLMTLVIVISISNADTDYQKKYKEQVEVNIAIDNAFQKYKNTAVKNLNRCELENTKLKAEKKEEYIVRFPFTDKGLTDEEVKGSLWTLATIYIHPVCAIGFFLD